MSYCSFCNDSDVYLYKGNNNEYIFFFGLDSDAEEKDCILQSAKDALIYLLSLKRKGYKVPPNAIKQLRLEVN